MPSPRLTFLVDTNVWIDNYDGARRAKGHSGAFFDRACELEANLLYAITSVKDVYYLIQCGMKALIRQEHGSVTSEEAKVAEMYASGCIDNMAELGCAVAMDQADVWLARKYQRIHPDFEDCLVMAAARRVGADYVITNDERFLRHSAVPALSPQEALALMEP